MIHTLVQTKSAGMLIDVPMESIATEEVTWYWIHFETPTEDEISLLTTKFKFHELSIEDCIERLERPKVDYFDTYNFFVLHAMNRGSLEPVEVDLFVGANYVVSFCKSKLQEMESVCQKLLNDTSKNSLGTTYVSYVILDKIVDCYFPIVYQAEDSLQEISDHMAVGKVQIDQIFAIRSDLLKLRYIVNSMKELLYRVINSSHIEGHKEKQYRFHDVYDHLLSLSDIIESNREVAADICDNYLSMNSHKMNKIMTLLTIISSIFIPLTFIVGIYGMNFDNIPELRWKYGYFIVLGLMFLIGVLMVLWFKRKGWLDIKK